MSRIPDPGDYFLFGIGNESVIVIRENKDAIRALLNVCRHRGSRICAAPEGNAKTLVCPYHQWVYGRAGNLIHARFMGGEFEAGEFGLAQASVRVLEGLIFICLAPDPPAFEPFAAAMTPRLRPHGLAGAKIAVTARYTVHANWKLVLENSRECYHCRGGHPEYCRAVAFAAAIGSQELTAQDAAVERERHAEVRSLGLVTDPVPFTLGGWYHFRRFYLRPGCVTQSLDGGPVAPLMGSLPGWNTGAFAIVTLPNLLLEANSDYVMTLQVTPVRAGVTHAEISWLVRGEACPGVDYEERRLTEFWRRTSEQDWKLCEDNQLGVDSLAYRPGPYGPHEQGVEQFADWYIRQFDAEAPRG